MRLITIKKKTMYNKDFKFIFLNYYYYFLFLTCSTRGIEKRTPVQVSIKLKESLSLNPPSLSVFCLSSKMAASVQLNAKLLGPAFIVKPATKQFLKPARIRCAAAATAPPTKRYSITLLPGDGIGPEVIAVAKNVLKLAGSLEGSLFPSR